MKRQTPLRKQTQHGHGSRNSFDVTNETIKENSSTRNPTSVIRFGATHIGTNWISQSHQRRNTSFTRMLLSVPLYLCRRALSISWTLKMRKSISLSDHKRSHSISLERIKIESQCQFFSLNRSLVRFCSVTGTWAGFGAPEFPVWLYSSIRYVVDALVQVSLYFLTFGSYKEVNHCDNLSHNSTADNFSLSLLRRESFCFIHLTFHPFLAG